MAGQNWVSGKRANTGRVEDVIAGGYKSAFQTVVAQIQSLYAANLVMLVILFG